MRTKNSPLLSTALAQRRLQRILRILPEVSVLARRLQKQFTHGRLQASIVLVGPKRMRELNHKFRGKDRPTDVLSFEAPQFFRKQGFLGELVICSTVARAQAREVGHSPANELDILIVHGVLHLLGMDHELGLKPARAMERAEKRVLKYLKIGAKGLVGRS